MITSSDKVFDVSRRAMFAFAALPTLLAVSALAQTPVTDPLPPWKGKSLQVDSRKHEGRLEARILVRRKMKRQMTMKTHGHERNRRRKPAARRGGNQWAR